MWMPQMLCSTTNLRLFSWNLRLCVFVHQLGNKCMNMSLTIDNAIKDEQDMVHKNNKRLLINENDSAPAVKVQKVDVVQRIRRRNYALMLAYLGKDYYGMQRNPGMKTIEEDLLKALLKADLITEEIFENIQSIHFQRAARTDKGVSALRQVVSLKLPDHANKDDINQHLPEQIRVFGLKKVTKGFNSKNRCDARTYKYIIPTFAFAPEARSTCKFGEDIDVEKRLEELSVIEGKPFIEYRLSSDILAKLNSTLKLFEGTHNFHNYSSKVRPLDPRANRYIISFSCTGTFVANNMEFAILEVKGQSFMLHQIRKMVSIAVAVTRNIIADHDMNELYKPQKFDIPIAPSLGLLLNYVHYDTYNKKYGTDGIHETLEWFECEDDVHEFEKKYILKHVVDTEASEKTTLNWLASLAEHTFAAKEDFVAE